MLSVRAKEAIKTALAMTLAYGVALALDWHNPKWAGFAVAAVSLGTVGQSLNKGAMRMLGTIVAAVVALLLIALFPQDRWGLMLALSVYVGFCTYMMAGGKRAYFWFVCGFVCMVVAVEGANTADAFNAAIHRLGETGLGILAFSLVAFLLWPSDSRAGFLAATRALAATQRALYRAYFTLMVNPDAAEDTAPLRAQAFQQQARLDQLLAAAETDSYEVWELRRQWRRYRSLAAQMTDTMERWRVSFVEVRALDLRRLMPELDAIDAELTARSEQIERMLTDQPPERDPEAVELIIDDAAAASLSHFERAALTVTCNRLQHLDQLTRSQFECVRDIKGFGRMAVPSAKPPAPAVGFALDLDRLASVVQVVATMWLAYLAWIQIDGLPGGASFVTTAMVFGMAVATAPQVSVRMLIAPIATGVVFATVLYFFVMPHLSSFLGLGPMIFAATFAICYVFHTPRQALGRGFGLAMFALITAISNEQTYSFISVATTALIFPLALLLLALTSFIPHSPHPERAFLRLLARYFRSCAYLLFTTRWDPDRRVGLFDHWRKAFHAHELATLPNKLEGRGKSVPIDALPGTTREQVDMLVANLRGVTYRIEELLDARQGEHSQFLAQELLADLIAWRDAVHRGILAMSEDPAAGDQPTYRERLASRLGLLELRLKETMDKAADDQISDREGDNFYRLLGAYRGLSEALLAHAGNAGGIDWEPWRETRF